VRRKKKQLLAGGISGGSFGRNRIGRSALALVNLLFAVCSAQAQQIAVPAPLREVGIDQRLDETLPLDLQFRDERGATVRLGDYFREGRPVVVSLVYYDCPMLCTLILNGMVKSFRALNFDIGKHYEVVSVSIDPRETPSLATKKKKLYINKYARAGVDAAAGWHFLTGDEKSIKRLAEAVGFRYTYDQKSGQYAHASGIMVATPRGKLARYFYGIEYSSRDLRFAMMEASENRIGSPVDQVLLYCFHYDPATGRYSLAVLNTLRVAGTATVLLLGFFVLISLRREKRKRVQEVRT